MQKLFNADLLDLFTTDDGFIYACKETIESGKEAIAFFSYNNAADKFERISINSYIASKYSEDGFALSRSLGDFVTCRIKNISADSYVAAYEDGTIKLFDSYGIINDVQNVKYNASNASFAEPVGRDLWMPVPEENAIIKYSPKYKRIEFRIGSKDEKAFSGPVDISYYDDCLYICNAASYKIRTVSLVSFTVKDYAIFNEPIYRYFRNNNTEYVVLKSGVYTL
jgi:hypothetical protein